MNLCKLWIGPGFDIGAYVGRTCGYSMDVHKYVLSQNSTSQNRNSHRYRSLVHLGEQYCTLRW